MAPANVKDSSAFLLIISLPPLSIKSSSVSNNFSSLAEIIASIGASHNPLIAFKPKRILVSSI